MSVPPRCPSRGGRMGQPVSLFHDLSARHRPGARRIGAAQRPVRPSAVRGRGPVRTVSARDAPKGCLRGAKASGDGAKANGDGAKASGDGAKANGDGAKASGDGAKASGDGAKASCDAAKGRADPLRACSTAAKRRRRRAEETEFFCKFAGKKSKLSKQVHYESRRQSTFP